MNSNKLENKTRILDRTLGRREFLATMSSVVFVAAAADAVYFTPREASDRIALLQKSGEDASTEATHDGVSIFQATDNTDSLLKIGIDSATNYFIDTVAGAVAVWGAINVAQDEVSVSQK